MMKHNKKKNILFLYEAIFRKLADLTFRKSSNSDKLLKIIKENFHHNSELYKYLQVFQSVNDSEIEIFDKVLEECRNVKINEKKLEKERLKLIEDINKFDNSIYDVFVENYKEFATIYQFLNSKNPKDRVILKEKLENFKKSKNVENLKSVDSLTVSKFLERYNKEYKDKLTENQKKLVKEFIFSFSDNQLSLKYFLNEEVSNLKKSLHEKVLTCEELKNDQNSKDKIVEIIQLLESYKNQQISKNMIVKILKIQDLLEEMNEN